MMVLQDRDIVIEDSKVAASGHQELLIAPEVVQVVTHGCHQRSEQLQLGEVGPETGLAAEHEDGLGHVSRVYQGVVGVGHVVASLNNTEKR